MLKLMAVYILAIHGPMLLMALTASGAYSILQGDVFSTILILMFKIILPILYIVLCVWIIRRSDVAAERIFPENEKLEAATSMGTRDVQAIAYSCVGLLILAGAVPKVINLAGVLSFKLTNPSYRYSESYLTTLPQILGAFAQAGIGLYLIFCPQGFVNLWHMVRDYREQRKLAEQDSIDSVGTAGGGGRGSDIRVDRP